MIDSFSLLLSHGLLLIALWRLLARPDLDEEELPGSSPAHPAPTISPQPAARQQGAIFPDA